MIRREHFEVEVGGAVVHTEKTGSAARMWTVENTDMPWEVFRCNVPSKMNWWKGRVSDDMMEEAVAMYNKGYSWLEIGEELHINDRWIAKSCYKAGLLDKKKARIPQQKIDEIIRLRRDTDWSERKIGKAVGIDHSSINRILKNNRDEQAATY